MATVDPPLQAPVSGCAVCAGVVPQPSAGQVKSLRARLTAALGVRWSATPAPVALCQRCLRRLRDVEQLGARHCRLTAALTQLYSRAAGAATDDTANACIACRSALAADDAASAFWNKTQFTSTTLADMLAKLMPDVNRPEPGRPAGAGVCDPCVSRLNRLDGLFARFHQQARVLIHGLRGTAATDNGGDHAGSAAQQADVSDGGAADEPRPNPLPLLDEMLLRLSPRRDEPDAAGLQLSLDAGDGEHLPPLNEGSTEEMPPMNDGDYDGEEIVEDVTLAMDDDAGDIELLDGAGDVEGVPLGDGVDGCAAAAEEAEADEGECDDQDEDDPPAVQAVNSTPTSPASAGQGRPVGPPLRTVYVQLVAGGDIARVPSRGNRPPAAVVRRRVTAGRAPTKVEETVQVVRLGPSDKLVPRVLPYRKRPPPDPTATTADSSAATATTTAAAGDAVFSTAEDADDPTGSGDGPEGGEGETQPDPEPEPPVKRKRGRPRKTDVRGPVNRILHRKLQYVTSKALSDQKAATNPAAADLGQSEPPAGPGGDGPADGTGPVVKPADPEWAPLPTAGSDQVQEEHRHRLAEAMKRINERLLEDKRKQTKSGRKLEERKAVGGDDVEVDVEDVYDIDEPDDAEDLEDGEDTYSPEDGEEDIDDPEDEEDEELSNEEEDKEAAKEGEDTEAAEEGENIELSSRSRRVNGLYVCEVCQKSFALLRELLKHERSHTEAKFPCPMCNKSFTLPKLVRKHQKFHKTPTAYECELCGHRCRSQVVLLDHLHAHTGGEHLTCGVCGRSFATMSSYRSHQRQHTPGGRQPHCDDCGRVMQSRAALQRHRERSHTLPKYLPCPHAGCERRFDAEKTLAHHLLQHVSGPPWRCTLCDKEFRTKYTLRDHVRTHSGQKPHACELCGMRFSQRSNLTMHVRYVHQNDRRFACTLCGKRYKRRSLLHYHMLCHEGDRPLQCPRCPMRMVYPQHLKKHLQTHSGEKPHSCGVCHKSFSRRDNLRAHMFTHSNKKQFECRQCGTGFVRKMSLLQHMEHFGHGAHPDDYVINRTLLTTEPAPAAEEVHTLELMDTPDGQLVVLVTDGVGDSGVGVTPGALRSGRHIDLILHQSAKIITHSDTGGEGGGDDGDGEELVLEDSAAVDLILQSAVQTADGQLIIQDDGSGTSRILQLGAESGQTLFLQEPEDGTGVTGAAAGEQQWILQEVPDDTGLTDAAQFTDAPVLQAPPT